MRNVTMPAEAQVGLSKPLDKAVREKSLTFFLRGKRRVYDDGVAWKRVETAMSGGSVQDSGSCKSVKTMGS
jgi:hypothetical protein